MIIIVDNLKINYRISGVGSDVVLLHGWGCSIKHFEVLHDYLEKTFRVTSVDFPGFGESDFPSEPWNMDRYRDFTLKFFKALNIESPILFGHSFGGRVSIKLAEKIPVKKFILIDSAGIKPKRTIKYYFKVYSYKLVKRILTAPFIKNYTKTILIKYRGKAGSADYQALNEVMKKSFVNIVNEDLTPLLKTLSAPTLLIWGENDTITPCSDGKIMEEKIPDAGLVILKNVGHFSYLEKSNEFIIIITNFLKKDMEASGV
ncbi:MAG TPA: alpha/beta hydrolase [Clostridiaceae bacterium]